MKIRNKSSILAAIAMAGLATGVQGCWPVWKTTQRSRSFLIEDEAGKPVPSATVAYISLSYPYGREESRKIGLTGADGRTSFTTTREWQTEALMIHGSKSYTWRWCVSAPGYQTFHSQQDWGSEAEDVVVRLKSGASEPCSTTSEIFIQGSTAPLILRPRKNGDAVRP